MSPDRDLISNSSRTKFRVLMVNSTLSAIKNAFEGEGFGPDPSCSYEDSSQRKTVTQRYLSAVDWTDPEHVDRALRVFEELIEPFDDDARWPLRSALRRDGYEIAADGGIHRSSPEPLSLSSMAGLRDPAAILDNLGRIQRAADTDDPALVIGSAKELVESTAKTVLAQLGHSVNEKHDVPQLVAQAQQALQLHPSAATPGPDGSDAVKKILGAVITVTTSVAELRNRTGTGHGAGTERHGLAPRHARLAVNAARTWCELILDTLADTKAPWQRPAP